MITININNQKKGYIENIPSNAIEFQNGFWRKKVLLNNNKVIPNFLRRLKKHGIIDNFKRLVSNKNIKRKGPLYTDSDLYKWIEATAYLDDKSNEFLNKELNKIISIIMKAQEPDGYLNTYFVGKNKTRRWKEIEEGSHELYCAGHLIEAALALYSERDDERLLDVATKFSNLIYKKYMKKEIDFVPGHPEIELALLKLYVVIKDNKYLDLAGLFLEKKQYSKMKELNGHAVRALYYNSGLTDYYRYNNKKDVRNAYLRLWNNMMRKKIYVTGGVGGRHQGESVGKNYELPNQRAYAETCAAVANIFWNNRLFNIEKDSKYMDTLELTLYNAFLAGISLSGDKYFYVNPLRYDGKKEEDPWYSWARKGYHRRKKWYKTTCCPTNSMRLLASLKKYIYGVNEDGLWINLYCNNTLKWKLKNGTNIKINQKTDYPNSGNIKINLNVKNKNRFKLHLRIPGWANNFSIKLNNKKIEKTIHKGYLVIEKQWYKNENIEIVFKMEPFYIESNPMLFSNTNKVALQKGPLIYCFEGIDNQNIPILKSKLDICKEIEEKKGTIVDEKINKLIVKGLVPLNNIDDLYYKLGAKERKYRSVDLVAIPYYTWANRGNASMTVWIERK